MSYCALYFSFNITNDWTFVLLTKSVLCVGKTLPKTTVSVALQNMTQCYIVHVGASCFHTLHNAPVVTGINLPVDLINFCGRFDHTWFSERCNITVYFAS